MKILVTGSAGFIGSYVARRLIENGDEVVGMDNINDYYSTALKYDRLKEAGIENVEWGELRSSKKCRNYRFVRMNLEDRELMQKLFDEEKFDYVCHLAAQAGVRYSIENPYAYIDSNIVGFINILECCRNNAIKHLVYASSSSVYGLNGNYPFSEQDSIAHPVSLYAATKKSNELMAHTYSHLYNIPTTGVRFFTVYGPWGRPDMSPFLFTDAILRDKPIKVFNNGDMYRDFTFIDDIVEGVLRVIYKIAKPNSDWSVNTRSPSSSLAPYRIYNIGNSKSIKLMDYIHAIENACGNEARKEFLPMQAGDVYQTYADTSALKSSIGYRPSTDLLDGVIKTVNWYKSYYKL